MLAVDSELAEAVPAGDRPRVCAALLAREYVLERGPVNVFEAQLPPSTFALLVVSGILTEETSVGGRSMLELLLPGDIVLPWQASSTAPRSQMRYSAPSEVRLAALDHQFIKAAAIWPDLLLTVQRRLGDQRHRLATHGAICQLPRVEERLLAILWHLASRSGTVGLDGTTVPWPLSHQALAGLVGASRPTVSLAIKMLQGRGYLSRRDDGKWVLPRVVEDTADLGDVIPNVSEL